MFLKAVIVTIVFSIKLYPLVFFFSIVRSIKIYYQVCDIIDQGIKVSNVSSYYIAHKPIILSGCVQMISLVQTNKVFHYIAYYLMESLTEIYIFDPPLFFDNSNKSNIFLLLTKCNAFNCINEKWIPCRK